jgi:uncharacterized repeat protein (TIGR04138 family)
VGEGGVKVDWSRIRELSGVRAPEAFQFLQEGLEHTVGMIHGDEPPEDDTRHVDGSQLCLGLREHAIEQYGMLARTVLRHWGIHRTEDFGKMVFALVECGLMRKTEDDSIEDFQGVYDFDEAFAEIPVR